MPARPGWQWPGCRFEGAVSPGQPLAAGSGATLGLALIGLERYDEAEVTLREALGLAMSTVGERHYITGKTRVYLGAVLVRTGRPDDGEQHLIEAYEIVVEAAGAANPVAQYAAGELATLYDARAVIDPQGGWQARAAEWRAKVSDG